MRRPIFFISIIQATIGVMALEFGINKILFVLLSTLIFSLLYYLVFKGQNQNNILKPSPELYRIIACFFIAIALLYNGYFVMEKNMKIAERFAENSGQQEVKLECVTIYSERKDDGNMKVVAYPRIGNGYSGKTMLNCHTFKDDEWKSVNPAPGDHIIVTGKFQIPKPASNPRCFNYRNYLKGDGIFLTGFCKDIKIKRKEKGILWNFKRFSEVIRREFLNDIIKSEPEVGGAIRGVVIGDRSTIDESIYDKFRLYGTAHILAVSGLHIGILVTIYRKIYRRYPNHILTMVFVIALIMYGEITRWSPSVFRAITMSMIFIGSQLFKRDFDLITALGISGMISISINPAVLFSLGFQMSYLAILGIGILGRRLARWIEIHLQRRFAYIIGEETVRKMSSWMGMYLGVQIMLTPFILQEFNYFTPFGLLFNLPIGILGGLIVSMGILSMGLTASGLMPLGGGAIFQKAQGFVDTILYHLGKLLFNIHSIDIGEIAGKNINMWLQSISPGSTFITVLIMLTLLLSSESFYIMLSRKRFIQITICLCIVVALGGVSYFVDRTDFDNASVVMVDVGQGDCLHVRSHKGINMVFDGGGSKDKNMGKFVLLPYFLRNGVGRLDMVCVTHRDTDHAKGLYELRELYKISSFVDGAYMGKLAEGDGVSVNVLWPIDESKGIAGADNELSSVYRIDVDGISVLVTGDIGVETEKSLIKKYGNTGVLSVDILKVGHHGSRYSTSDEFLRTVNPKVAVIGVGKNNYGHPALSIIDKLGKNDIMTYRTDEDGAIGIWKENGSIKVCTMLEK